MKRIIALILALLLLFSLSAVVFAADTEAAEAAERLGSLGLLKGVGTNADGSTDYDLESGLTREQAVIMLVRLLGKEEEALSGEWEMPFTDVSAWAADYVGYAYANGLASGTGAATFHGKNPVTAAQYLTFVLRALGYSSATDFVWSSPWALADAIGLTGGRSYSADSAFVRADMAIISSNALDCQIYGSDKTLLSLVPMFRPEVDYTKEDYLNRVLSDAEIAALKFADMDTLRKEISTVGDAVAFLNLFTPGMFYQFGDVINMDLDELMNLHGINEATFPHTYTVFTAWCLTDDYEGIQYVIATGVDWGIYRTSFALALPVKDGYYLYSPFHVGDLEGMTMESAEVSSLDGLENVVKTDWNTFPLQIFLADANQTDIMFSYDSDTRIATPTNGNVREVYAADNNVPSTWDEKAQYIRVSRFSLPDPLVQTTLSYADAKALVGQDPELIAEKVKTVGDVLQYMIAARFSYDGPPAYTPWYGRWGFDAPGDEQIEQNFGCCCGGFGNTVAYLLEGDYEKQGRVQWLGGGNHVINWVYTGGKYYVFDFTLYCAGGNFDNYDAPVTILDDLSDYYDKMPSDYPKSEINALVVYEADGKGYPEDWADDHSWMLFPSEAEGKITVVYPTDGSFTTLYEDIDIRIPGWSG